MDEHQTIMKEALKEAEKARDIGEVPVGALIVRRGEIISRSHNRVEREQDATQHAEILAIKDASERLGNWRLSECELYVTLEPCLMCAGAIMLSRISRVYFGARDPRIGALGSLFDISQLGGMPHQFEVYQQLLGDECSKILKEFFASQRKAV